MSRRHPVWFSLFCLLQVLIVSVQCFAPPAAVDHSKSAAFRFRSLQRIQLRQSGDNNSQNTNANGILSGESVVTTVGADREETVKSAIVNTILTIGATGAFGSAIWFNMGSKAGEEFFAGYLVEQSLSVDNLFVFLILFEFFKVPEMNQNRVLKWGIIGAMAMRAVMVLVGLAALESFKPVLLVFAGILVFSSYKILQGVISGEEEEEEDMSENKIVQFSKSLFDSTDFYDGDNFFTLVDGVKKATPLLICLIAVELSDVVFAVDSIPAVFGVTQV